MMVVMIQIGVELSGEIGKSRDIVMDPLSRKPMTVIMPQVENFKVVLPIPQGPDKILRFDITRNLDRDLWWGLYNRYLKGLLRE